MARGEALPRVGKGIPAAARHHAGAFFLVAVGGVVGVERGLALHGGLIPDDTIFGWRHSGGGDADGCDLVILVVARQVCGGRRGGFAVQSALEEIASPAIATGQLAAANEQLHSGGELPFWMRAPAVTGHPGIAEEAAIGAFSLLPSHGKRPLRTA